MAAPSCTARLADAGAPVQNLEPGSMTRLGFKLERLSRANVALAPVNDMAALSTRPHLRRVTVDTPNGPMSFPAPAPRFAGETRRCGPVPGPNPTEA